MADSENKKTLNGKDAGKKGRLLKTLPTERINFQKQIDILRAYGASHEATHRPVGNTDVASMVGLNASTISLANAFFIDVGFLQRTEGGFIPAPELLSFCHAHQWDEEKAPRKLAPLIGKSWFAQALAARLKFKPMAEDEAVQVLAEVARADKDYLPQLRLLLDYLAVAGIVTKEGGQVRPLATAKQDDAPPPPTPPAMSRAVPETSGEEIATPDGTHAYVLPLPNGRKVTVVAPLDITVPEIARLKKWIEFTLQVDWSGEPEKRETV